MYGLSALSWLLTLFTSCNDAGQQLSRRSVHHRRDKWASFVASAATATIRTTRDTRVRVRRVGSDRAVHEGCWQARLSLSVCVQLSHCHALNVGTGIRTQHSADAAVADAGRNCRSYWWCLNWCYPSVNTWVTHLSDLVMWHQSSMTMSHCRNCHSCLMSYQVSHVTYVMWFVHIHAI